MVDLFRSILVKDIGFSNVQKGAILTIIAAKSKLYQEKTNL